ncbi:MAG: hypothetical protein IJ188_04625 [Clostridia bacterium]|nr:hypothetical protein [Clostridia bacterium]
MAKKRKKSSSFGLGILDGLIDLAGGAAMNSVANHMEKKYHYSAKGKINPYRVSAIGIASGRMKTTRQIMRTGAYLGAKGSFNVTTDPPGKDPNERTWSDREDEFIVSDDPLLNAISDSVMNDNRYAWRLNCEPGWQYGIDPEDYETREEYNEALELQKSDMNMEQECQEDYFEDWTAIPEEAIAKDIHNSTHVHCLVSRLDNGSTEDFYFDTPNISVGDIVEIETETGTIKGVIVRIVDMQ